jgi:hypothetical protein
MSYDLYFVPQEGKTPPRVQQLMDFFEARGNYEVSERQAIYENGDTGVYFIFDLGTASEEQPEAAPLSFSLNLFRPHVFGLEAASELRAVVDAFQLQVIDPQSDSGDPHFSEETFLATWNESNEFGYRSCLAQGAEVHATLPTATIEMCWRWNLMKGALQDQLGDDVFAPCFMYMRHGGQVLPAVVWPDGIPIALPEDVELVIIQRKEILPKKLLGSNEDLVLASWEELAPLMHEFPLVDNLPPYRLLRYDDPLPHVVEYLRRLPASEDDLEGVPADCVLNAELVAQHRKN